MNALIALALFIAMIIIVSYMTYNVVMWSLQSKCDNHEYKLKKSQHEAWAADIRAAHERDVRKRQAELVEKLKTGKKSSYELDSNRTAS